MFGFAINESWSENAEEKTISRWDYNSSYTASNRMGLLTTLMALPRHDPGFFALSDIEQAWFNHAGEVYSAGNIPPTPSEYNRTPAQIKSDRQQWQTSLRNHWLTIDVPLMVRALTTWVYALGLVELGFTQNTLTALRLTKLGHEVLHGKSTTASPSTSANTHP